jgi:hypothetical protein
MAAKQTQVAKFYKNNRGNLNLIDESNHVYVWNQGKRDTPDVRTYWKCREYKICDVKATVLNGNIIKVPTHKHGSNLAKLESELQTLEAIARAIENPQIKPRQILAELSNQDVSLATRLARRPEASLTRTIQKKRALVRDEPPVPTSFKDLLNSPLPEKYSKTKSGDPFLLLKDVVTESSEKGIMM